MAELSLVFDILARDKASKEFRQVGDAVDDTGKKASKFGPSVAAGAAVAGAALVGFASSSVKAFVEAEQSSARLDDALKKFPATNDVTRASFDKLNQSLASKTRFDDDATASGQAVLAQFGLTGTEIQKLTPLLQDYAAKTGTDLPAAAEALGKATLGQGRALKSVGIDFKDTGSKAGNLDAITAGLRRQVGGFAEAEGKTAAGQAQILGNRFGEVQETVGAKLTPVLTTLAGKLLEVIGFVERNEKVIVPLVTAVSALALGIVAVSAAAKAYTAVQAALNIVLSLNPIGLLALAIAALVAGFVLAYKKSETFRSAVDKVFSVLKKFVGFTPLGLLIRNFDKVKAVIDSVLDRVRDLISAIGRIKFPKIPGGGLLGKIPGFAHGGILQSGLSIVGERGPELVFSGRGGQQVLSNSDSQAFLGGGTPPAGVSTLDAERISGAIARAMQTVSVVAGVRDIDTAAGRRVRAAMG